MLASFCIRIHRPQVSRRLCTYFYTILYSLHTCLTTCIHCLLKVAKYFYVIVKEAKGQWNKASSPGDLQQMNCIDCLIVLYLMQTSTDEPIFNSWLFVNKVLSDICGINTILLFLYSWYHASSGDSNISLYYIPIF